MPATHDTLPAEAQARLQRGERLLLVGVKATNLPPALRTHPRVTCWPSGTAPRRQRRSVPVRSVVVLTKWSDHSTLRHLTGEAARAGALVVTLRGTHALQALVRDLT